MHRLIQLVDRLARLVDATAYDGQVNITRRPAGVRLALPAEAPSIAAVQLAWLAEQPGLAQFAAGLDAEQLAETWQQAIIAPPLASYRVLVALDEAGQVVGFAAVEPSDDPDAQVDDALVAQFCIDPAHQEAEHDDRLLHAVADTLRADGFVRATWWVQTTDDSTRALLNATGWVPDGAHRELGTEDDQLRLKQVRLHTALS